MHLLRARIDAYAEYVPSAAIAAARVNHLTEDQLDSLLGVNFKENLVQARNIVDQQAAFGPQGVFAADHHDSSAAPVSMTGRRRPLR